MCVQSDGKNFPPYLPLPFATPNEGIKKTTLKLMSSEINRKRERKNSYVYEIS